MLASVSWIVANRTRYIKQEVYPAFDFTDPGWANGKLLYLIHDRCCVNASVIITVKYR